MDVWEKDRKRLFNAVASVIERDRDTFIEKSGVEVEFGTSFTDDEFMTVDAEKSEIRIFTRVKGGSIDEIVIDEDNSNLLVMLEQILKEVEEIEQ